MAKKYIDLEVAIKTFEELPNCYNGFSDTYDKACIIGVLEELPAADVVEVVRCKDCKHRYSAVSNMAIDGNETWRHECLINRIPIRLDWFCADGRRRTDESKADAPDGE